MGCIKSNSYTENEQQMYLLARALAHPARIRMVNKLKKNPYRNVDFSRELNLATSTVKKHIDMLKEAELVEVEYFLHHYSISLNTGRLNDLETMI